MLIKESQLTQPVDALAALSEATYLSEAESVMQPITVPVREMSRFGEGCTMVRFDDVARLAEDHGVSYIDAMQAIAEASEVDPEKLTVAVDEAEIICDPEIVNELANVVVAPLSESSLAYRYVAECIDAWADMDDTAEVDAMLEAALVEDADLESFLEAETDAEMHKRRHEELAQTFGGGVPVRDKIGNNAAIAKEKLGSAAGVVKAKAEKAGQAIAGKGEEAVALAKTYPKATAAAGGVAVAGGLALGYKLLKAANNKPKSWIGQKIAALRNIYKKWMEKAQKADSSAAGRIKAAAGKLLSIIDQLMAKLQKAAG